MPQSSMILTETITPSLLDHEIITLPKVGHPERDDLFKQCFILRIEVFSKEQGFPSATELDE